MTLVKRPYQGARTGPDVTETRTAAANVLADLRAGQLLDATFERRTSSLDAVKSLVRP